MKYELIALDLDDTLLNDEVQISQENVKAIEYAHSKGIKVVFATGRSIPSTLNYTKQIRGFGESDYFISYNGGVISNAAGKILFYRSIKGSLLQELISLGRRHGVDVHLYSLSELFIERETERTRHYMEMSGLRYTLIDLSQVDESIKVLYNSPDIAQLETMKAEILREYSEELNVFFSKDTFLEVLTKDANKGFALKYLCEHLHINQKATIAIGDGQNDIYMIEWAGLGACVKNGKSDLKRAAQYVTEKDNNEGAVAEVIYKFI